MVAVKFALIILLAIMLQVITIFVVFKICRNRALKKAEEPEDENEKQ